MWCVQKSASTVREFKILVNLIIGVFCGFDDNKFLKIFALFIQTLQIEDLETLYYGKNGENET